MENESFFKRTGELHKQSGRLVFQGVNIEDILAGLKRELGENGSAYGELTIAWRDVPQDVKFTGGLNPETL